MNSTIVYILILIPMNIIWAGSYAVVKIGLDSMNPLELVFWRFGTALVCLLAWIIIKRPKLSMKKGDILRIATAGFLLGMSNWLWVTGIKMSFATDASLLYVFEPIWGIILAGIILREKLGWTTFLGLFFVIAGLAALSNFDAGRFGFNGGEQGVGNLIIVASLLFEGLYSVIVKPVAARVSAPVVTAGTLLIALIVISIPIAQGSHLAFPTSRGGLVAIGYLAILCTVIGYTLWVKIMKHVPLGVMLFTVFLQPIAGPFIAATLLGEKIDSRVISGGILLISGMFVAVFGHMRSLKKRHNMTANADTVTIIGGV